MISRCIGVIISLVMLFNPLNPTGAFQLSNPELCDMEGFTVITCSMAQLDINIRGPEDPIRLINGMIFKPLALGPLMLGGREVAVLGIRVKMEGREHILYKLVIDFEPMPYDVMRIR